MADTKTTARPERVEVMLNRIIMAASRGESARADERAIVERVAAGDAAQTERDALATALAASQAREAGLRKALESITGGYSVRNWDDQPDAQMTGWRISHGQMRAAARALAEPHR